jgi:5-methylcytosine-specific restriction endonuclease McrA
MLTVSNCVPTHRECNLRQGNMLTHEGPFANRQQWVADLEP